jgi:transposase
MTMLADQIDAVVGVDTHADTHTAAVLDARGGVLARLTVPAHENGYGQLLDAVLTHAPGPQVVWALEGSGSYGTGLARALQSWDQQVIEVRAAKRERGRAKNDAADAVAIARGVLGSARPGQPRRGQVREALAVLKKARDADVATRTRLTNQLKAALIKSPEPVRAKFRDLSTSAQVRLASRLRQPSAAATEDTRAYLQVLRETARQIHALDKIIDAREADLDRLTTTHAAPLRAELGVGPISAAQLLISYSHRGRFPSAGAFAMMAGTAPLEASSGKIRRHRLNRSGDRQLNAALHRILLTRKRHNHPETLAYITRRSAEGRTPKEIDRCLKRALSDRCYKILETLPTMP